MQPIKKEPPALATRAARVDVHAGTLNEPEPKPNLVSLQAFRLAKRFRLEPSTAATVAELAFTVGARR